MLSLPPPTAADMMHGCPFVRLPDSAADVTVFLKALFDYNFFGVHPAPTKFSTVAGILRMSDKYEIDAFRKRALTHISSFRPTTLHEWEELDEDANPFYVELLADNFLAPIVLARQLFIDWILPIASSRICKLTFGSYILRGYNNIELNSEDKLHCMIASGLMESARSTILDFLWRPLIIDACESERECTKSRLRCRRTAEEWREIDVNATAPMPLDLWATEDWDRLDVCDGCLRTMKVKHQAAKQAYWDRLHELFGLPNWTALEAMKIDAFQ